MTITGSVRSWVARASDEGSLTSTLSVSSGAVTMKMISSTSITSMYGTTLISDFSLRRLRWMMLPDIGRPRLLDRALALQDGAELLGEALVAHGQAFDARGEAVVGPHCRNRHEQADGGGEQRLGDARRHRGDAGLLAAVEHVVHGHHDPEHGTDQAHVGRGGPDVGQQFQVAFE